MALSNDELNKAVALLKKQAEEQEKIGNSLEGYINGLKKVKAIEEEVNRLNEIRAKIIRESRSLTGQAKTDALNKLAILREESKLLKAHGDQLKENLKTVNKTNLLMSKGMASLVKGVAGLPNLIEKGYGKLKGFGLFEMDKSVKKTALNMGLMTQSSKGFSNDIRAAAKQTSLIGVGMQDLSKIQNDYSEELGRNVMLNESGLQAMANLAAATTLGAEGTAKMAADLEQQGYSAERTSEFVEKTMNDTSKMGLNASKVIKNVQQNIKMLNKYNFKGGIKGLANMAKITTKLGIEMNSVTGMADKLFDIEGAVEMSSQLQVLGGAWASLADPFHLMYMARNDMAGLTEEIGQAAASSATFNKETGEFEISSMEMHRLRKIAEQTGVSYEDLATAGKNAAKFSKIKGQVAFGMDKDAKEFLANTAKFDKDGKAEIEFYADGKRTKKFVSDLKQSEVNRLISEKKSLKERAEASITFDESLTNFINSMKVSFLPFIDSMNDNLAPKLLKLADEFNAEGGWGEKVEYFAKTVGGWISSIAGFIIEWPKLTLGLLAFSKGASFILEKASWFGNGVMLAKGFNMGTGGKGSMMGMLPGGKSMRVGGKAIKAGKYKIGAKILGNTAGKAGLTGSALSLGVDAYQNFTDESLSMTDKFLKTLDENKGKIALGVIGGILAPFTGGLSVAAAAGLGATLGSVVDENVGTIGDYGTNPKANDAILSGGKITPIDNKDDLLAMKPNGAIDKVINQGGGKTMKIEFGEIHFKFDELKVTSPGSPGLAIDLMKDPVLMRELTRVIHVETEKVIKGGKVSG